MNKEAERHLDKAAKLIVKGDGFYVQASNEIRAAQEADSTASNREIGERIGKQVRGKAYSATWVRDITNNLAAGSGVVAWTRGSHGTTEEIQAGAKKLLAEAPMEQVEQMVAALPKERQQQIAAAADPQGYAAARVAENERVAQQTPAEKKEIEAAKGTIGQAVKTATASFITLGVVGHLEQATEDLTEMISDQSVTAESLYRIRQAHALFVTELQVAEGMVGLEVSEA